jgi:hypothetical protein
MNQVPKIDNTPENRFKLTVYNSLLMQGVDPAEAASRAKAAWIRKQQIYNSWHAKLVGWIANIVVFGGALLLIRWVVMLVSDLK